MRVQISRDWKWIGLFAILLATSSAASLGDPAWRLESSQRLSDSVITSPCEGFFYVGENPGDPPLVDVGSNVQPSTVVGYVQSMDKVPIVAGTTGTILEVLVTDCTPVESGETLFRVGTAE